MPADTEVKYICFTWEGATHTGHMECPVLPSDDETSRDVIERAARRAFYSLVHAGYGDLDEVKVYYKGEWIKMDPQKEEGEDAK